MELKDIEILPGVRLESVTVRCVRLREGDYAELRELDEIMDRAYDHGEVDKVGVMAKLLLKRDHLPAFYKAKAWAYLSSCDGQDGWTNVLLAEDWMEEARRLQHGTGWIPRELDQWTEIIARQKAALNDLIQAAHAAQKQNKDKALDLVIRPGASTAARQPHMMEDAMEPNCKASATNNDVQSGAGPSTSSTAMADDAEVDADEMTKEKEHIPMWADT